MSNNKLLASVKKEISNKKDTPNRFELANEVKRNPSKLQSEIINKKQESKQKLIKLYENDLDIITNIRTTLMVNQKESTQSDIIRLGLLALSKLNNDELFNLYDEANINK